MMCLLNLAQIAEQTGALLSVSCRLVRSLISSKQSKISVGLYFRPGKQGERKTARFFCGSRWKNKEITHNNALC